MKEPMMTVSKRNKGDKAYPVNVPETTQSTGMHKEAAAALEAVAAAVVGLAEAVIPNYCMPTDIDFQRRGHSCAIPKNDPEKAKSLESWCKECSRGMYLFPEALNWPGEPPREWLAWKKSIQRVNRNAAWEHRHRIKEIIYQTEIDLHDRVKNILNDLQEPFIKACEAKSKAEGITVFTRLAGTLDGTSENTYSVIRLAENVPDIDRRGEEKEAENFSLKAKALRSVQTRIRSAAELARAAAKAYEVRGEPVSLESIPNIKKVSAWFRRFFIGHHSDWNVAFRLCGLSAGGEIVPSLDTQEDVILFGLRKGWKLTAEGDKKAWEIGVFADSEVLEQEQASGENINHEKVKKTAGRSPKKRKNVSNTTENPTSQKGIPSCHSSHNMELSESRCDIFISHASEDKDDFVRPLAQSFIKEGLKIWYDEYTLYVGDSLREKIDDGLSKSRFGIVVLSHHFFTKEWPKKELDGLVARETSSAKVILPIWHGVKKEDVLKFSPILADRVAVISNQGIQHVVNEILKAINRNNVK